MAEIAYSQLTPIAPRCDRPFVSGGSDIKAMIDALDLSGDSVPDYLAEFTTNNADCATQMGNPALGGHQLDNYWTRTRNMAVYFAPRIDTTIIGVRDPFAALTLQIFPNPNGGEFKVILPANSMMENIAIMDLMGKTIIQFQGHGNEFNAKLPASIARGSYIVRVQTANGVVAQRIFVQ